MSSRTWRGGDRKNGELYGSGGDGEVERDAGESGEMGRGAGGGESARGSMSKSENKDLRDVSEEKKGDAVHDARGAQRDAISSKRRGMIKKRWRKPKIPRGRQRNDSSTK